MNQGDKKSFQLSVFSSQFSVVVEQTVQDFKKLKVWEKSHQLTVAVYEATGGFPKEELYGLTSQIRRSCASIPANIAEGCGRGGKAELGRFLRVAMGSASELEYHLILAHDLHLLDDRQYQLLEPRVVEVKRMLAAFIQNLRTQAETLRLPTEN